MTGYLPYMAYASDVPDDHIDYMTYKSDNYVISPAAGFIFDSSNVTSELTNLQTEIISSIYPIKVGMVSYEDNIDAAIEKLKAAGLDKYLEDTEPSSRLIWMLTRTYSRSQRAPRKANCSSET